MSTICIEVGHCQAAKHPGRADNVGVDVTHVPRTLHGGVNGTNEAAAALNRGESARPRDAKHIKQPTTRRVRLTMRRVCPANAGGMPSGRRCRCDRVSDRPSSSGTRMRAMLTPIIKVLLPTQQKKAHDIHRGSRGPIAIRRVPIRSQEWHPSGPRSLRRIRRRVPHPRRSKSRGQRPGYGARNTTRRHWTMITKQLAFILDSQREKRSGPRNPHRVCN